MWTRVLLVIAMAACLAMIVVAPTRHTASDFFQTIVDEHGRIALMFGDSHGAQILDRMRQYHHFFFADSVHREDGAAAGHGAPNQFGRSAYGEAMDAMLRLALYRAAYFVEFLPLLIPLLIAFVVDGLSVRSARAREFLPHSPAIYGLALFSLAVLFSFTVVVFCYPTAIHPLWLVASPALAAVLAGRVVSSYHKHI